MRSIAEQNPQICFLCGKWNATDTHHVFEGRNRNMSERYGLTVRLCRDCHRKMHDKAGSSTELKRYMQNLAMTTYHWTLNDWIERFGKNYLEEF